MISLKERVKGLVRGYSAVSEITDEMVIKDLIVDSLDYADFLCALEEWGIVISYKTGLRLRQMSIAEFVNTCKSIRGAELGKDV